MTVASARPAITRPSNFRDLAEHARPQLPLREGVLFRSDHLGALDEADARQIEALGIRRVLDFRGAQERTSAVCALSGVQVHSLAIEPTVVQVLADRIAAGDRLTPADAAGHMQDTYRGFVRQGTPRFAAFFAHLLESDEPTVFHCTAGKDRTGFAAALLLHALGASPEAVMRDYLLTNERLRPPAHAGQGLAPEVAAVLWGVQPSFLQAASEAARQDYGSLDGYLRDGMALGTGERERLRAMYLHP